MERSPFTNQLLLTVGGYSWAIWSEVDNLVREKELYSQNKVQNFSFPQPSPVLFHYVGGNLPTHATWSLTQPHVVMFSDENGYLQLWNVTSKKSKPFQTQDISGKPISCK